MVTFTNVQKLACDISRNIAVTAGAGSGKTSVLVERYLWCLRNNGYRVRRIVAITFTEKAAGEMLGRIRERVLDYSRGGLGDPNRWEEVLEKLSLANVSTIHSFCQRLLREFPVEAGVDPNFEVLDEAAKRICLTHLINDAIRQRAATYDTNMATLAEIWTPSTLQNVLLQLLDFRETSLPWAQRIIQETFPQYMDRIQTLVHDLQQRGIRQIVSDPQWQETITQIRALIPEGDTSKLTHRCKNILDYDTQFRGQTNSEEQLLTLQMLRKDCRLVAANKAWKEDARNVRLKEAFNQLKFLYDRYLPTFEIHEGLEESGFSMQHALAELFLFVYRLYQQEKTVRRVLDFDDLQEYALVLLENPVVHSILSRRYDYIMVDEFQDTNQLQWNIIRKLGLAEGTLAQDRFCIVGDEKQSIYMFRGAEVAVFGDVRRELQQANRDHAVLAVPPDVPPLGDKPYIQEDQKSGELIMAENFRSIPSLIFFFNYLFSHLFPSSSDPDRPYDVQHQELIASREREEDSRSFLKLRESGDSHPVEFLFVHHTEDAFDEQSQLDEPELVALRIRELLETVNYADIAILLRTRTRLKEFEDALRRYDIPFVVAGGIGFYQQQEIYDLVNLLRILVDYRQDIALAGVLRSPLLSFSDDQLLYVALGEGSAWIGKSKPSPLDLPIQREQGQEIQREQGQEIQREQGQQASKETGFFQKTWFLWEKLEYHAHSTEKIPEELDPPKFLHAYNLLSSWKSQADRIPITHLLRHILEDTGLYGILSGDRREVQSLMNIEKLLDIARTFEGAGFQTLSDFVTYLDLLIELEEREGEAQLNFEGIDAVRLMTIHAAKGLEFPVVFVPELERPFNYGTSDSVYIDTIKSGNEELPAIGIKGLHPDQNYASEDTVLRKYLRWISEEKTDAEMKRLLYVACTRAEDHLILSGNLSKRVSKNSWMAWLLDALPLEDSIPQQRFTIPENPENQQEARELEILIYTSEEYGKRKREVSKFHLVGGENGEIKDFAVKSRFDTPFDVSQTLQQNLTPIRGHENEIFRISPSTVHILFQCPRKYYYQHILKLPGSAGVSPAPGSADILSASDAGETPVLPGLKSAGLPLPNGGIGKDRGTIIHKAFEEQFFDEDRSEEELLVSLTRFLDAMNIPEQERQAMQLHSAIKRAYESYKSSGIKELLASSPKVYREYPFQMRTGRIDISGTIDVLFFDPHHEMWTILDYKSNEIPAEQITEEIQRHGYDIQMQLYALAISRLLHVERIRSMLFFTFPGHLYDAIDLSSKTLKALEKRIVVFLEQLSEGTIDVSQKQLACEDCEYSFYEVCS